MVPAQELMLALARLQSQKNSHADAPPSSGRDREKHGAGKPADGVNTALGEIGRNTGAGFPPSEQPIPASPDPAFNNRPIEPLTIAQSRLYYKEGLQKGLQQPLQRHATHHAAHAVVVGVDELSSPKSHGQHSLAFDNAIWPTWIAAFERVIVWTYLSALPAQTAQNILDEMDWSHQRKGVSSPPGLARMLSLLAAKGEFLPEGAHKIRAQRQQSQQLKAAVASASQASQQDVQNTRSDERKGVPAPDHVKQKLALTRQTLVMHAALIARPQ